MSAEAITFADFDDPPKAVGRTWGRCCELLQLWVDPAYRTRGVASRLLRQFEQRAASRGCDVYYLTTLSFQAPGTSRPSPKARPGGDP